VCCVPSTHAFKASSLVSHSPLPPSPARKALYEALRERLHGRVETSGLLCSVWYLGIDLSMDLSIYGLKITSDSFS